MGVNGDGYDEFDAMSHLAYREFHKCSAAAF